MGKRQDKSLKGERYLASGVCENANVDTMMMVDTDERE